MAVVIDIETKADSAKRDLDSLNKSLAKLVTSSNNSNKALGNISANSFKNINNDLKTNTKAFENFGKTGSSAFSQLSKSSNKASESVSKVSNSTNKTSSALSGLKNTVLTLSAAFLGMRGVSAFNKAADDLTSLQNRLKLVVSDTEKLREVQKDLYKISKETNTEFGNTIKIYSDFSRANKSLRLSQQELLNLTKTINQSAILSGSSVESVNAALVQFSQGISSGAFAGDELRSVLEQIPYLAQGIATQLEKTTGELKKFASEGGLSPETVIKAVHRMAVKTEQDFKLTVITSEQAVARLAVSFNYMLAEINQFFGASERFAKKLLSLSDAVDTFNNSIRDSTLILTQRIKNYIHQFDLFDAMTLLFVNIDVTGRVNLNIDPFDAYDRFQTILKIKKAIGFVRDIKETINLNTDVSAETANDPQFQSKVKNKVKIIEELNTASSLFVTNIKRLMPEFRLAVVTASSQATRDLKIFGSRAEAVAYEQLIPFARSLESIAEKMTLWRIADNALSRSWVNLFNSKNLVEFTSNLEELNKQRQKTDLSDSTLRVLRYSAALNTVINPIQTMLVELNLLDNALIRIQQTRLDRIIGYFKNLGKVVTRVYQDIFAPTLEPFLIKIAAIVIAEIEAVADAINDMFNLSSGKEFAKNLFEMFNKLFKDIKVFFKTLESNENPLNNLFKNIKISKIQSSLITAFKSIFEFIKGFFLQVGNEISDSAVGDLFDDFSNKVQKEISYLKHFYKEIKNNISEKILDFKINFALNYIFNPTPLQKALKHLFNLFEKLSETGESKLKIVQERIKLFSESIIDYFYNLYDKVVGHSYWPDMIDGVNEYAPNIFKSKGIIENFKDSIVSLFKTLSKDILNVANDIGGIFKIIVNKIAEQNISDIFKVLGERSGATFLAGILFSFGDPRLKIMAVAYFVSLTDAVFKGIVTDIGPYFATIFGSMIGQFSANALKGLMTILNTGINAFPDIVSKLISSLSPVFGVFTSILSNFEIFQNSLLHGILLIGAAWALFTKKGSKDISEILFGKAAKKGKPKTEGVIDYLKAAFISENAVALQPKVLSFFDKAFNNKKLAYVAAAAFGTAIFDSISIIEASQFGIPLLAFAIMGKDGGGKILRESITMISYFGSTLLGIFLRRIGLESAATSFLKSLIPEKPEIKSAFEKAGSDLFSSFKQMVINLRSNSKQLGSGVFSFKDALLNTREDIQKIRSLTSQDRLRPATNIGKITRIPIKSQLNKTIEEFSFTDTGKKLKYNFDLIKDSIEKAFLNFQTTFEKGFKILSKLTKTGLTSIVDYFSDPALMGKIGKSINALLGAITLSFKSVFNNAKIGLSGSIKAILITISAIFGQYASAASNSQAAVDSLQDSITMITLSTVGLVAAFSTIGYLMKAYKIYSKEGFGATILYFKDSIKWITILSDKFSDFIELSAFKSEWWKEKGNLVKNHFKLSPSFAKQWISAYNSLIGKNNELLTSLGELYATETGLSKIIVLLKIVGKAFTSFGSGAIRLSLLSLLAYIETLRSSFTGFVKLVSSDKLYNALKKNFTYSLFTRKMLDDWSVTYKMVQTSMGGIDKFVNKFIAFLHFTILFLSASGETLYMLGNAVSIIGKSIGQSLLSLLKPGTLVKNMMTGLSGVFTVAVEMMTTSLFYLARTALSVISGLLRMVAPTLAIVTAVGAFGLYLFGPGNTFVDKVEWAYDKIRSIFDLQPTTRFGKMNEMLEATKPISMGGNVADLQSVVAKIDVKKQNAAEFVVLKEAADAATAGLKDLQTLYIKQGYVSEEMLQEWNTLVNNFKDIASNQPQDTTKAPESLKDLAVSMLEVKTTAWDLTKALLGISDTFSEEISGIEYSIEKSKPKIKSFMQSLSDSLMTGLDTAIEVGFVATVANKISRIFTAISLPKPSQMALTTREYVAQVAARDALIAGSGKLAVGAVSWQLAIAATVVQMTPAIKSLMAFGTHLRFLGIEGTSNAVIFDKLAKKFLNIDDAGSKVSGGIDEFLNIFSGENFDAAYNDVLNNTSSFLDKFKSTIITDLDFLFEYFGGKFKVKPQKSRYDKDSILSRTSFVPGESYSGRLDRLTREREASFAEKNPKLVELSSKTSMLNIDKLVADIADPELKAFTEAGIQQYKDALKAYKIIADQNYDPSKNPSGARDAKDFNRLKGKASKDLFDIAVPKLFSLEKNVAPIAKQDKLVKEFASDFAELGDNMKNVLGIDMGVKFKDFFGNKEDIEKFKKSVEEVRKIDIQLAVKTNTYEQKSELQKQKAKIIKNIDTTVSNIKAYADKYGTVDLTLSTQANIVGGAEYKSAVAMLQKTDANKYERFSLLSKALEENQLKLSNWNIAVDGSIERYDALEKKNRQAQQSLLDMLPKNNWVDALNEKLQKLNLTAINVESFAYFSKSDTEQFNSQLDSIIQKEKDLSQLRSDNKPFEEQIKALKEIFMLQQNVAIGLEQASNKALSSAVKDSTSTLSNKITQYEKLTGDVVPNTVKATGEAQQYMDTKIQIKELETASKSGQLSTQYAAQEIYKLEENLTRLGVITKLTLDSIISSFGDLGLTINNLSFSRLSSDTQTFLASLSSEIQSITKILSETEFSSATTDLLKRQEQLLMTAADVLIEASYKTGEGISSALSRLGLSENSTIANLNRVQLDNLLEMDKAAEKARILASRASNPEDYLKKLKEQARATIRGTQQAESMANSFDKNISNLNEVFKTSLDGFDATTMSPQIISSAMDIARELKNELEIAISENQPTADLFEKLRSAELMGGFITIFKDLGTGLRDAIVGGAKAGFDKIKSAYSESQMTFKQYAGLDPSRRRQRAQEATAQEAFKRAANMELSPKQAEILNRIGSGEDIQKVMKDFEDNFKDLLTKSDNPIVVSQDNLKKSIDALKESLDIERKDKQITSDIASGKISQREGIDQLNTFVSNINKSKDIIPTEFSKDKGVGNLTAKTLLMAEEASSKKKEFEDLGMLLSKANFKGVLDSAEGFSQEVIDIATKSQLKQAAKIKVELSSLQAKLAEARLKGFDTQELQKKVDSYTNELSKIPYAIDYARNAIKEAGVSMRDAVDSSFRTGLSDLMKGKVDEGLSPFQTFVKGIKENIKTTMIDNFSKAVSDKLTGPGSPIAKLTENVGAGMYGMINKLISGGEDILSGGFSSLLGLFTKGFGDTLGKIGTSVKDLFTTGSLKDIGDLFSKGLSAITGMFGGDSKSGGSGGGFMSSITGMFSGLFGGGGDSSGGGGFMSSITGMLGGLFGGGSDSGGGGIFSSLFGGSKSGAGGVITSDDPNTQALISAGAADTDRLIAAISSGGGMGGISSMLGGGKGVDGGLGAGGIPNLLGRQNGGLNSEGIPNLLAAPDQGGGGMFSGITDSLTKTFSGLFGDSGTITDLLGSFGKGAGDMFSGLLDSIMGMLGGGGGGDIMGSVMSMFGGIGGFFADGGLAGQIKGAGTGKSDSIPAMLSNGEFIVNAKSTKENLKLLTSINSGRIKKLADGGLSNFTPTPVIPTLSDSRTMMTPKPLDTSKMNGGKASGNQIINMSFTGDISRQTKAEVFKMLPDIANGINIHNKEKGYKR